jgi:hypothetical protein
VGADTRSDEALVATVCRPRPPGKRQMGPREEGDEITLEPLRPRTFDKTSPVTAYWLPRCDGFEVVGGRRQAVVEHAVFDDDPLHPVALRVRVGNKRRRLLPIDAVEAVCPLRRLLYVRRPPSVATRAGNAVGVRAGRAARTTGYASVAAWRVGVPRARSAAQAAHSAARRHGPSVRRGAVLVGKGAYFVVVTAAMLAVAVVTMAGRFARFGVLTARRYAPTVAGLARRSIVVAHGNVRTGLGVSLRGSRRLRQAARQPRRRRPVRISVPPLLAVDDTEGAELLDTPLRAELHAMHDPHVLDEPDTVVQQTAT